MFIYIAPFKNRRHKVETEQQTLKPKDTVKTKCNHGSIKLN